MSTLSIPTHVARRVAAQKRLDANNGAAGAELSRDQILADAVFSLGSGEHVHALDTPVPEGLPNPGLWRITLMPVAQRRVSKGNIVIPQIEVDLQDWTHMLWKVCAVGPLVYRGPAYKGFDEEELAPLRPQVGELWLADPKHPRRFHYTGPEGVKILFIVVNDDQLWSKVDPAYVEGLEFRGLAL